MTVVGRLAAQLEDGKRFAPHLDVVTHEEQRGITTPRNIAVHSDYGAIDPDIFWRTVTERTPKVTSRIRAVYELEAQTPAPQSTPRLRPQSNRSP
ncbi:hypothetical protein ACT3SP_15260 [Brachybacterium sp. AOP43-C2-M15]|uniref:hypothetical protein n=1 Tax=Brachybacterium sp. AOP43-C2-M15 TaxID=3457661 RepID=UPI00403343F9